MLSVAALRSCGAAASRWLGTSNRALLLRSSSAATASWTASFSSDAVSGGHDWNEVDHQVLDLYVDPKQLQAEKDRKAMPPNPYTSRVSYSKNIKASSDNPVEHTAEDCGLYYDMGEDVTKMFPDGLCGTITEEFATTGASRVMIRENGINMTAAMKAFFARVTESDAAPGTLLGAQLPDFKLLMGPRGSGKSAILNYIVHYARKAGWVTMVVPSAFNVMNKGQVISKSPRARPGFLDQHDVAAEMLRVMLELHGEQLAQIPQQGVYPMDRYLPADVDEATMAEKERLRAEETETRRRLRAEADARGEAYDSSSFVSKLRAMAHDTDIDRSEFSLKDMAEWALRHASLSTDALLDIKAELQKTTKFPVLIAVDGLNHFYEDSIYPLDNEIVDGSKMSIPNAFRFLNGSGFDASQTVANGMIIAATSNSRHHELDHFTSQVGLKRRMKSNVLPLSRPEVHATLMNYASTGRFFLISDESEVDANAVEYYRMLSNGRPALVYDTAMFH